MQGVPMEEEEKSMISMEKLMKNSYKINSFRTVLNMAAGGICGIMGYVGSKGFLVLVLTHVVATICSLVCMRGDSKKFINVSPFSYLLSFSALQKDALLFILFWTLFYALVYLY